MRRLFLVVPVTVLLYSACGTDTAVTPVKCTLLGCESTVTFAMRLEATQDLSAIKLTICRNGDCASATPSVVGDGGASGARCAFGGPVECSFRTRGDGAIALLAWRSVGVPAPVDGDTVRYLAEDTKLQTVLVDVTRQIDYRKFQPNGSKCEPTCLASGAYLTPASASNIHCPADTCDGSVTFTRKVLVDPKPTTMTACRNTICRTVPYQADTNGNGGASFDGPLAGWTVSVTKSTQTVVLATHAFPDELAPGDHYTLKTSGDQVLVDATPTYETSYPGGQACATLPCLTANVTLP